MTKVEKFGMEFNKEIKIYEDDFYPESRNMRKYVVYKANPGDEPVYEGIKNKDLLKLGDSGEGLTVYLANGGFNETVQVMVYRVANDLNSLGINVIEPFESGDMTYSPIFQKYFSAEQNFEKQKRILMGAGRGLARANEKSIDMSDAVIFYADGGLGLDSGAVQEITHANETGKIAFAYRSDMRLEELLQFANIQAIDPIYQSGGAFVNGGYNFDSYFSKENLDLRINPDLTNGVLPNLNNLYIEVQKWQLDELDHAKTGKPKSYAEKNIAHYNKILFDAECELEKL